MAKEFYLETGELSAIPTGCTDKVRWRCATFDPSALMLTAIDGRRSHPHPSVCFENFAKRYSDSAKPNDAISDLATLVNGTFYSGRAAFGDGVGYHHTDKFMKVGTDWNADLAWDPPSDPLKKPYVPCRWWVGTKKNTTGAVAFVWGRGAFTSTRDCNGESPGSPADYEMLLGGGVLLHDPSINGFDVISLSNANYKTEFNDLNHGFWKPKTGSPKYVKPYHSLPPGSNMEHNPLSASRRRARWGIGPCSEGLRIVSVGDAHKPECGMTIIQFAKFAVTKFGLAAFIMFDGSKPHGFVASEDTKTEGGMACKVFARPRYTSNTFVAVFRRFGCNITGVWDAQIIKYEKVTCKSTDLGHKIEVNAPYPAEDPSEPLPEIPIEFELRNNNRETVLKVDLVDQNNKILTTMPGTGIRFNSQSKWNGELKGWKHRPLPGSIEKIKLRIYVGSSSNAKLTSEHEINVKWKHPNSAIKVFPYGTFQPIIIDGLDVTIADSTDTYYEGVTKHGLFSESIKAGRTVIYLNDRRRRYKDFHFEDFVNKRRQTVYQKVEEILYPFEFTVIDGNTHQPIDKATAQFFHNGKKVFPDQMSGADGKILEHLPFAKMKIVVTGPGYNSISFDISERTEPVNYGFIRLFREAGVIGMVKGRFVDRDSLTPLVGCNVELRKFDSSNQDPDQSELISTSLTEEEGRFAIGYRNHGSQWLRIVCGSQYKTDFLIELVPDITDPNPDPNHDLGIIKVKKLESPDSSI